MFKISETLDMSYKQLGEMYEGDSADTRARKFPLTSLESSVEGPARADPGARTLIGVSSTWAEISFIFNFPDLFRVWGGGAGKVIPFHSHFSFSFIYCRPQARANCMLG